MKLFSLLLLTAALCAVALGSNGAALSQVSRLTRSLDDPLGRCCYQFNALDYCLSNITQVECESELAGAWTQGLNCYDQPTCFTIGRCCYDGGESIGCEDTLYEGNCRYLFQNFVSVWTPGATCNSPCPALPTGRCCFGDQCQDDISYYICYHRDGYWTQGAHCSDVPYCAPVPHGRCCYWEEGFCTDDMSEYDCQITGGGWTPGLRCDDQPYCAPIGRCCYVNNDHIQTCTDSVSQNFCERAVFGTWMGGLTCDLSCSVTCSFPSTQRDEGDLPACNYPTQPSNPSHRLSGIAWLGAAVDGETTPNTLNLDQHDDGVTFVNLPWNPCEIESVYVDVTAGPQYSNYIACGRQLYLTAWKDGNADGDFCDEIPCNGVPVSEWIIQDLPVQAGHYALAVRDPGLLNIGQYDGIFRFRLTSGPTGRYGFGAPPSSSCTGTCGIWSSDYLGEVEDYILSDGQLSVELSSFELVPGDQSVTLNWKTASETDNHHFQILRDDQMWAEILSQGNAPSGYSYTWTDENLVNGTTYRYSLVAVDISDAHEVLVQQDATPHAEDAALITEYALHQNFPNPFNLSTMICFDLPEAALVTLNVYNIQGQKVSSLINGMLNAGAHSIIFDAATLPSGVYLYRLDANGFSMQQKMLLLK